MRAVLLAALVSLLAWGALGSPFHRRALGAESKEQHTLPSPYTTANGTLETPPDQVNSTTTANRISNILKHLPTIKNVVIFVSGFSTFLIVCLLVKIFRSGKRIRKTRKYDIITTPAERVEMAPLNEENYEEEDSTVFDVKYRYRSITIQFWFPYIVMAISYLAFDMVFLSEFLRRAWEDCYPALERTLILQQIYFCKSIQSSTINKPSVPLSPKSEEDFVLIVSFSRPMRPSYLMVHATYITRNLHR